MTNAAAYKIYRGDAAGKENELLATFCGSETLAFVDTGTVDNNVPPTMYYVPGSTSELYAKIFYRTTSSCETLR